MKSYDDGEVHVLLLRNGLDYLPDEIIDNGLIVDDFEDIENIECEDNEITGHCLIECNRDGMSVDFNSDFIIRLDEDGSVVNIEFLDVEIK